MNFDLTRRKFIKLTGAASVMAAAVPSFVSRALGAGAQGEIQTGSDGNGGAGGDGNMLWRIGAADHSSDEFSSSAAAGAQPYDTGAGNNPKRWPRKQGAKQTCRIRFSLDEAVPASAILAIEGFYMEPGPSAVKISINGKNGRFRLTPKYARDSDMRQGRELAHNGFSVRAPVDASFLRSGANEITITAVGKNVFNYDALWMERSAAPLAPELEMLVEPAIFFRRRDGQLFEEVALVARHNLPQGGGGALSIAYKQGAFTHSKNAIPLEDFGEYVVETMEVPAFDGPQHYELTASAAGKNSTGASEKTFTGTIAPEKRWKLFAGLKIHNDVGFTDYQPNVEELDGRNTDRVLELAAKYPLYKFNLEVAWLAVNYTRLRTRPRVEQLMQLVRENRVGIGAWYLNLPTSVCDGEELYRALYAAKALQRDHGAPVTAASLTDTPSQCWSVPSYLADAGVKGFVLGGNQHRGPLLMHSRLNENSPFLWEGPDGRRVMAFFSRAYRNADRIFGTSPAATGSSLEQSRQGILQALARYRRDDYAPDAFYIFGQTGDNAYMRDTAVKAINDWNAAYAYPEVIFATDADYFDYIEKNFAGKLPVFRGDAGAYWADALGSSTAPTIINRDSRRLLPAAETFLACASLFDKNLAYPAQRLRDAWEDVLFYDEHTWGAGNSITQPDREFVLRQFEFKQAHAVRGNWAAKDLLTRALARLTQFVTVDRLALFVFNPALHARSDFVTLDIRDTQQLIDPATGKEVPCEIVLDKGLFRRLRFLAKNVPGLGYKTYEVRGADASADDDDATGGGKPAADTAAAAPVPDAQNPDNWQIETRHYRLVLDRKTGAIAQLIDKELNRDLADAGAPWRLNELVYAAGGEGQQIVRNVSTEAPTRLDVSGQAGARLLENVATPFGRRIRVQARARNVPFIESEIAIYDAIKRVDIRNRIRKEDIRAKEALYFAFPFRAAAPRFQYQVQNAWADPNDDQLPGSCREWFATQNLVLSRDAGAGVTVALATPDFPLVTLTDINRGQWLETLALRNGHVYSYIANNYWSTNIKASQSGDLEFRYHITSGKDGDLDAGALAQFDAQTRSPLIPYSRYERRYEPGPRPMPAGEGALFEIDAPNAHLSAFKQAEDANGFILRLRETSGRDGTAVLKSPWFKIEKAWLANGVEENLAPLPLAPAADALSLPLKARQHTTVRLVFSA